MASKQNGPQPTPISVLITLFTRPNQPPLVIEGIDKIDIKTQIEMLNPDKCGSMDGRNGIVRKMEGYADDLRTNAYKRIRFKSMLCQYHKHYFRIKEKHFEMIKNWNDKDFALNVIVHFLQNSDQQQQESKEKEQKRLNTTWRFLDYLSQYFDKKGFNGQEFIEKYIPNKNNDGQGKKASGFGLTIVKEVCKQFEQKTGQYTKVKKQLTAWAKKNAERHQEEVKFDLEEIKEDEELYKEPQVAGHSKSLSEAFEKQKAKKIAASNNNNNAQEAKSNNNIGQQQQNNNNNNSYGGGGGGGGGISGSGIGNGLGKKAGEKWYWFCDEGGIKWVPYKDEHQDIIEDAWCKEKPNVIVMERFKIDFHRDNQGVASGQQYNYQIHNSWRRGVIRGKPDPKTMLLNDIPCEQHPK